MNAPLPIRPNARLALTETIVSTIAAGASSYAATDITPAERRQLRSLRGELAGAILEVPLIAGTRLGVLLACLLPQLIDGVRSGDTDAGALTVLTELAAAMYGESADTGAE